MGYLVFTTYVHMMKDSSFNLIWRVQERVDRSQDKPDQWNMWGQWGFFPTLVYDQSRIFDLMLKPKFSFQKIKPSAEGISQSSRYEVL